MEQLKIGDKVKVWDRSSNFYGATGKIMAFTDLGDPKMTRMVGISLGSNSIFGTNVVVNEDSVIKL